MAICSWSEALFWLKWILKHHVQRMKVKLDGNLAEIDVFFCNEQTTRAFLSLESIFLGWKIFLKFVHFENALPLFEK